MTVANLEYLTSEQALADGAVLQGRHGGEVLSGPRQQGVVFGGSYSGSRWLPGSSSSTRTSPLPSRSEGLVGNHGPECNKQIEQAVDHLNLPGCLARQLAGHQGHVQVSIS
ncbi:hypothetical protein MRX96_053472 [Rhipicephalus microplus]